MACSLPFIRDGGAIATLNEHMGQVTGNAKVLAKTSAAMRPSATFNTALAALGCSVPSSFGGRQGRGDSKPGRAAQRNADDRETRHRRFVFRVILFQIEKAFVEEFKL